MSTYRVGNAILCANGEVPQGATDVLVSTEPHGEWRDGIGLLRQRDARQTWRSLLDGEIWTELVDGYYVASTRPEEDVCYYCGAIAHRIGFDCSNCGGN